MIIVTKPGLTTMARSHLVVAAVIHQEIRPEKGLKLWKPWNFDIMAIHSGM